MVYREIMVVVTTIQNVQIHGVGKMQGLCVALGSEYSNH